MVPGFCFHQFGEMFYSSSHTDDKEACHYTPVHPPVLVPAPCQ